MDAEPLEATIDSPKRRRVANEVLEQQVPGHGVPESSRPLISPAAEKRKSITQQIRDARTEEQARELLMDVSCAEKRRRVHRKKLNDSPMHLSARIENTKPVKPLPRCVSAPQKSLLLLPWVHP